MQLHKGIGIIRRAVLIYTGAQRRRIIVNEKVISSLFRPWLNEVWLKIEKIVREYCNIRQNLYLIND